ncbi:MAG: hypothetical protein P8P53_11995 [Tateyamaria sp.]|nr:hypothetical protein [Tateyamaria sp.]
MSTEARFDRIYFEDFENGADGWTNNYTLKTESLGAVLGSFAGDVDTEKTFDISTGPDEIRIHFDFIEMDSWDGEEFVVWINGIEVSLGTFHYNDDELSHGSNEHGMYWVVTSEARAQHGEGGWSDQKHFVTIDIPQAFLQEHLHEDRLTVKFDSRTNSRFYDESYAIDNFEIRAKHDFKKVSTEEDFEYNRGIADGWSLGDGSEAFLDNELDISSGGVLGRFTAEQDVEKVFRVSNTTEIALVSFTFIEMDSWDDEEFVVWINGTEVSLGTFKGAGRGTDRDEGTRTGAIDGISWSFVSGQLRDYGGGSWADQRHNVTMTIPKQHLIGDSFKIKFDSRADPYETVDKESFAIDDFKIETLQSKHIVVAAENFDTGAYGWSHQQRGHDQGYHDGAFLGRFGKDDDVEKTFELPAGLESLRVEFDFLEFDSWDNENFKVWIDDVTEVNLGSFKGSGRGDARDDGSRTSSDDSNIKWSFTSGPVVQYGGGGWGDQKHFVTIDIPAAELNGDSVKIKFDADTSSGIYDESYGIDNFRMKARVDVEPIDYDGLTKVFYEGFSFYDESLLAPVYYETGASRTKILGRFSGGQDVTVGATFSKYDLKHGGEITFDFYELDSWDNEEFNVTVNGHRLSLGTFAHDRDEGTQSGHSDGLSWSYETTILARDNYGSWADALHDVTIRFDQNVLFGHSLNIGFDAKLDSSVDDESYGINHLKLSGITDFITGETNNPDFASGHINRGNALYLGEKLVRGEALVSDDYSTALYLNHDGEVEILNDANGDGNYETITSLFDDGGFFEIGLTNGGAIYAENTDGRSLIGDSNVGEDLDGHRLLLDRREHFDAVVTMGKDGSLITSIDTNGEVTEHNGLQTAVHLVLDRFETSNSEWASTTSLYDKDWLAGFRNVHDVSYDQENKTIHSPDDLTRLVRLDRAVVNKPVAFHFQLEEGEDYENIIISLGDLSNKWDIRDPDHMLSVVVGTLEEKTIIGTNYEATVKQDYYDPDLFDVYILFDEFNDLPSSGGWSYVTQSNGVYTSDPFMKIHLDMGANDSVDPAKLAGFSITQKQEKELNPDDVIVGYSNSFIRLSQAVLVPDANKLSLANDVSIARNELSNALEETSSYQESYNFEDIDLNVHTPTTITNYYNHVNNAMLGLIGQHNGVGNSHASLADYNELIWLQLGHMDNTNFEAIGDAVKYVGFGMALLYTASNLAFALSPLWAAELAAEAASVSGAESLIVEAGSEVSSLSSLSEEGSFYSSESHVGSIIESAESDASLTSYPRPSAANDVNFNMADLTADYYDTAGSQSFWEGHGLDKWSTINTGVNSLATTSIAAGTYLSANTFDPAAQGVASGLNMKNVDSVFQAAVNAFAVSADASGDDTYLQYARNLESTYDNFVAAAQQHAGNVAALDYLYTYIAPKKYNDNRLFVSAKEEEGFWKALGLKVEHKHESVYITGNRGFDVEDHVSVQSYTDTFTVSDDTLDLQGASSFTYRSTYRKGSIFEEHYNQGHVSDFHVTLDAI